MAFVVSVPACLLTFYLVHLQGDFILFWAVYLASISISIALALLAGAVSSNVDTAGALLPSYSTSLLYFAGFLIPFHKIPPYWQWFSVGEAWLCVLRSRRAAAPGAPRSSRVPPRLARAQNETACLASLTLDACLAQWITYGTDGGR